MPSEEVKVYSYYDSTAASWVAFVDKFFEYGYGETREAAIQDAISKYQDGRPTLEATLRHVSYDISEEKEEETKGILPRTLPFFIITAIITAHLAGFVGVLLAIANMI